MKEYDRIKQRMAELLGQKLDVLDDDAALAEVVSSSFLLIETIIELQEDFGVLFSQEEFAGITTVGQLVTLFVRHLEAEPDHQGRFAT